MNFNKNLARLRLSGIRAYTNLAKETPGCIMLTIGEPDFDTPESIKAAAVRALEQGMTHYAPNPGLLQLRQAVARQETARGYSCAPEQVLITVGATGALYTALTGILEPGDQVIVPSPAFPLYESLALANGAEVVSLPIAETGFQITRQALEQAITPKTKAIVLNSPNNPSGTVLSKESLAYVKNAVLGKDIWVVCDNVYNGLCDEPVYDLSLDREMEQQVLVCQSFSKPYAMTGWRVGYLAGPKSAIEKLQPLLAAQIAAVPTFLQYACVEALKTDVGYMNEAYKRRRELVCNRLRAMGIRFPAPAGAFYVLADIRPFGLDSGTFCTRLIQEGGVAAVPGSCFGAEGFVRFSCACSEEDLSEAMDRLEKFIKTL